MSNETNPLLDIREMLGRNTAIIENIKELLEHQKTETEEIKKRVERLEKELSVWKTVIHTMKVIWYILLAVATLKIGDAVKWLNILKS